MTCSPFSILVLIMLFRYASSFKFMPNLYKHRSGFACRSISQGNSGAADAAKLPVVINTENVPVYLFCSQEVEEAALEQLKNLARSVIPVGYVSAMPDVHLGAGATIGSVFASEKYVSPNSVGTDIGCGMIAIPFPTLCKDDLTDAVKQELHSEIKRVVPTGFNHFSSVQNGVEEAVNNINAEIKPTKWLKENILSGELRNKALCQIGTLGGGNHFIEVLHDENDGVWLMLHSGSRFVGKFTADHYNKLAKAQMDSQGVKDYPKDLFYLNINSAEGKEYLNDMLWCQKYAYTNREFMLNNLIEVMTNLTGAKPDESKRINAHHNFCELTRCTYTDPQTQQVVEKNLWVTRKGATAARLGQYGIIPGSMGVGSYIIRGRGNSQSWESCSHGAGRLLSRTAAKKILKQEDFQQAMAGIVYDNNVPGLIDEAPMAYKNLDQVMSDQASLVEVVHRLLPLINVKGFEDKDATKKYNKQQKWKRNAGDKE